MNTKLDDFGPNCEGPFPGSARVERMVNAYLKCAAEFSESTLCVVVFHPRGENGITHFTVRNNGNPHSSDLLARMWVEGGVEQGGWYVTPGGILAMSGEDGEALVEWDDGVRAALESLSDALADEILPFACGMLVLAAGDGGINGSTKVLVKAYGNSLACGGAVSYWLRERGVLDG